MSTNEPFPHRKEMFLVKRQPCKMVLLFFFTDDCWGADGSVARTSGSGAWKRLDRTSRHGFSPAMRRIAVVLVGVLATVAAGCVSGGAETDAKAKEAVTEVASVSVTPEMLRLGRTAYRKYCVQCHGYSGKGDGTSAASLDPPPRDHTNAEVMEAIPDLTIAGTIRFGGVDRGFPNMPAFPHVSHDELVALVAYVRSLNRPGLASVQIGDVE